MGKVVKTVLKVAAVAAVAYFAPPLAASIGPSLGITSALGTTALAAGIGAGIGKLVPGVTTTQGMFAGGLGGAGKTGLMGGASPTATATTGAGATTPVAAGGDLAAQGLSSLPSNLANIQAGANVAAANAGLTAPQTIGGALSAAAANPTRVVTQGLGSMTSGLGAALGGAGGALNLGAVAPQLLAAGLVGSPGGAMAKAQEAELQRAQQVNAALTQQRLDQANQLIGEAAYYDPEYIARQAAEAAMIKGGIQTAEQTRGLTGERLAAERRRMALGTSRTAGTAYQQGYGTGVGARVQTRQAGIQSIPTEFPLTNPQGAISAANTAREAKAEEQAGLAALFGQVIGQNKTASLGV